MATKKVWIGSVGPFLYDDATRQALYTDGIVRAAGTPAHADDLIKKSYADGVTHQNSVTFGDGTAALVTLTFDCVTNDGVLLWSDGNDWFQFNDDILINGIERLYLGDANTYLRHNGTRLEVVDDAGVYLITPRVEIGNILSLGASVQHDISGDAITLTASNIKAEPQSSANDDLDTINGGSNGDLIIIRNNSGTYNVTLKHGIGNLKLHSGTDIVLNTIRDRVFLIYDGGQWYQVAPFSNNPT